MPILKDILDTHFAEPARKRGYDYFLQARPTQVRLTGNTVTAVVLGTLEYDTSITFSQELAPLTMQCSCPASVEQNCKHLVAVLFSLNYVGFFTTNYYREQIVKYYAGLAKGAEPETHEEQHNTPTAEAPVQPQPEHAAEHTDDDDFADEPTAEQIKRQEQAKLAALKHDLERLAGLEQEQAETVNYSIVYYLQPFGHRTILRAFRRQVNASGKVTNLTQIAKHNINSLRHVPLEERMVLEYITRHWGDLEVNLRDKNNRSATRADEDASKVFSGLLEYLRGKNLFLSNGNGKEPVALTIASGQASAFLTEEPDNAGILLRLHFTFGAETVPAGDEVQIISDNPLWVLHRTTLYAVDNLSLNNYITFEKGNGRLHVPQQFVTYFEEHLLPAITLKIPVNSNRFTVRTHTTLTERRIYLDETNGSLRATLKFAYGPLELPYVPGETIGHTYKNNEVWHIERDVAAETKARKDVLHAYTKELQPGIFAPRRKPVDFLLRSVPKLREAGFTVFGETGLNLFKVNRVTPRMLLTVVSGIDWFDVEAKVTFGESAVPLSELLSAFKEKRQYVQLGDGSVGLLPREWLRRFHRALLLGERDENIVRFTRAQAGAVETLMLEADEHAADDAYRNYSRALADFSGIAEVAVPAGLTAGLRDYQKKGLEWLYFLQQYNFGGILADDMGLGKTIQVLALLLAEKAKGVNRPSLVVAPTSVIFNWLKEAAKFAPSLTFLNHTGTERVKDSAEPFSGCDVVITSYAILLRDHKLLRETPFHYIILDESQKIKNPLSKSARLVKLLRGSHRVCLTGTPVENNLLELWSQVSFCNPGMLGPLARFQELYTRTAQRDTGDEPLQELKRLIYPFILRRTKDLVAPELPRKTEILHYCEMEPEQQELYEQTRDALRADLLNTIDRDGMQNSGFKVIEALLRLRQICNHPQLVKENYRKHSGKYDEFLEMVEGVTGEGHKVLVFSQFVKMLEIMSASFKKSGVQFAYLTGSTKDREAEVENFQNNPETKVFLISLKAGGFGLNLTAADYVFHYDPWWNPAVEAQATDRTHRIGQDKNVFVYKFITRGSVEEKILMLQDKKRELVESIISSEKSIYKELTREDVEELFS